MTQAPEKYATRWREAAIRFDSIPKRLRKKIRDIAISGMHSIDFGGEDKFLRCLACHYVFDDQRESFQRIIRMLKNRGRFVSTHTCMEMLEGGQEIDGPYFHLSFDDGFRNVVTNAVPVLRSENVPAIMFVPSTLIGASWERAKAYSMDIAKYRAPVQMATWDELRALADSGIEVGSHTCTHARLSELTSTPVQLRYEIADSKKRLEDELGRSCDYIAYPFGKPGDYDQATLDVTRQAGYRGGFGIHRGAVRPNKTHPLLIPRHHFEPEWPISHIKYFANGNMEKYWARKMENFD